jgi:hypothetical protein
MFRLASLGNYSPVFKIVAVVVTESVLQNEAVSYYVISEIGNLNVFSGFGLRSGGG